MWIVFVIELQYFRRLTTPKARRDYQSEINSGSHATTRYAIAIGNYALLDGSRTEDRGEGRETSNDMSPGNP